jgi:hypothetical protein
LFCLEMRFLKNDNNRERQKNIKSIINFQFIMLKLWNVY